MLHTVFYLFSPVSRLPLLSIYPINLTKCQKQKAAWVGCNKWLRGYNVCKRISMQAKQRDKWGSDSYPVILSHDVIIVHLGARAKKASVLSQEPRTCITFRCHQILYSNMTLQDDRKGLWHLLDAIYVTRLFFIIIIY